MKLVDLLFDRRCGICNCHIDKGAVCDRCDAEIRSHIKKGRRRIYYGTMAIEAVYLLDYNAPVVKKLLFRLKRSANKDLLEYASELYYMAVPEDFCGVVVSCPRRNVSRRIYGHDQVEMPCRIMCKANKNRLKYDKLVVRCGASGEQKKLTKQQRLENVEKIFKVRKKDIPKDILVCDDVITTGSTVGACVSAITLVRSDVNVLVVALASRNGFSGV